MSRGAGQNLAFAAAAEDAMAGLLGAPVAQPAPEKTERRRPVQSLFQSAGSGLPGAKRPPKP
jgi:hypothetical protein